MQGMVQSCIACRVRYAMHQSTQKSFGDALEMHWKSMESDVHGCTLTRGMICADVRREVEVECNEWPAGGTSIPLCFEYLESIQHET